MVGTHGRLLTWQVGRHRRMSLVAELGRGGRGGISWSPLPLHLSGHASLSWSDVREGLSGSAGDSRVGCVTKEGQVALDIHRLLLPGQHQRHGRCL